YDVPLDYIGAANLNGLDPLADLAIEVWLFGSEPTDFVRIYLVGNDKATEPKLFALYREFELGSLDSYDIFPLQHDSGEVVVLGEAQIDLASSASPLALRFAEGELSLAISLRRGNATSPIKLLDTDRATSGIQKVEVDITAPQFVGFGSSGSNTTTFFSDSADLVVVGRANEELRAAEVVVGSATNGAAAPCASARSDGLFVAAPLPLPGGLTNPLAGTTPFQMTIYDRAFNPAVSTTFADYVQVGAVGPGPVLSGAGALVSVQVHDARTFAPVPNARVFVHEDLGAGSDALVETALTNAQGTATLGAAPGGGTVVTIDADGYDLWSYMDLPVGVLRVPLVRSDELPGAGSGTVTSSTGLSSFQRSVSDARRNEASSPFTAVAGCTSVGPASVCQYGPLQLVPGPLGALAFFAVENPISAAIFSPASYLRGFALDLPLPALSPGVPAVANLTTLVVLSDASTAQEDRAVAGPTALLDISASVGFLAGNQSGSPRISIEGLSPGIRGPLAVGSGIALDAQGTPPTAWAVRSALPGAADPTNGKYPGDQKGSLIRDGVLLPKLFLRTEVRDLAGSRTGLRTPLTSNPFPPVLRPPSVPLLVAPSPFAPPTSAAYDLVFLDTLPATPGLYRVTLTAASRRRWVLWAPDTNADPTYTVSLPNIGAVGGVPLGAGTVLASVSAFSWPAFAPNGFLFSELERRTEVVLDSAPVTYTQP
ncbi:MAG: carboxypeptidase-like regulatory domain-containing protein, partial [Planctomycetota bacterium]